MEKIFIIKNKNTITLQKIIHIIIGYVIENNNIIIYNVFE